MSWIHGLNGKSCIISQFACCVCINHWHQDFFFFFFFGLIASATVQIPVPCEPTQDRPNRNGKAGKAGKVTISRIQVDELEGTYKLPKVKSEVVYLGDPRIIGLEDADTKINTKGMSMECYAFVSRARFCEFEKILSQPQKQQTTPRKVILSVEFTQPQKRKYHRNFMNLLDLSRKIFPNADIYLPKMNCLYSYLKSEGRAICS